MHKFRTSSDLMDLPDGDTITLRRNRCAKLQNEPLCLNPSIYFDVVAHTPAPKPSEPLKLEVGCRVSFKRTEAVGIVHGILDDKIWVKQDDMNGPMTFPVENVVVIGPASNPYMFTLGSKVVNPKHYMPYRVVGEVTALHPLGQGGKVRFKDNPNLFDFAFKDLLPAPPELLPWEIGCEVESPTNRFRWKVIGLYKEDFWAVRVDTIDNTHDVRTIAKRDTFNVVKAAPRP